MNNKEIATKCLLEAIELLNEGARYRKEIKDNDGYSLKDYGSEAAKYFAKSKENEDKAKELSNKKHSNIITAAKDKVKAAFHEEKADWLHALGNSARVEGEHQAGFIKKDLDNHNKKNNTNPIHDKINARAKNESIELAALLAEAADILNSEKDEIDTYVEKYISKNKEKLVSGNAATEAFEEVKSSLNIDNAFTYEIKEFDGIPAMYMRSSKSDTLVLVYFAIKDEAKHIEFKPQELKEMFK